MSFSLKSDPRRRTYVRLIGEIQRALNSALEEEDAKRGLTQRNIADTLGKNKSVVSRLLSGKKNMTLESLADLAYALNRPVKVSLPARDFPPGSNRTAFVSPLPLTSTPPPVKMANDSTLTVSST
jgi:hypothetical protein